MDSYWNEQEGNVVMLLVDNVLGRREVVSEAGQITFTGLATVPVCIQRRSPK